MAEIDAVWENVGVDTKLPMPKPRRYHVAANYKNKIYVFGGQQGKDMYLNDVWALDTAAKTWTEVTTKGTPPTPRTGHSGALVGNRLCIFGGLKSKVSNNELWTLDLDTFEWTQIHAATADAPWPSQRLEHSAVLSGKHILIFGGSIKQSSFLNDLWRLDTDTMQWTKISIVGDGPIARAGALLSDTEKEGEYLFFGGFHGDGGFEYSYETWLLQLENDTGKWSKIETTGVQPRTARPLVSVRVGERVYVFGGYDANEKVPSPDLIYFDLNNRSWSTPVNLWLNSEGHDMGKAFASSKGLKPLGRYGHAFLVEKTIDEGQPMLVFTVIAGSGSSYLNDTVRITF